MSEPQKGELTRALNSLGRGGGVGGGSEPQADVFPTVYHELKRLAHSQLVRERRRPEFQTTMVVNEAYMRLMGGGGGTTTWESRAHFYGAAARAMRQILVDAARKRKSRDRHRMLVRPSENGADGDGTPGGGGSLDLLALEDALEELERIDPALGQVVSLRFHAGLSVEQAAEAMGVSPRTVKRQWSFARAWLFQRLSAGKPGDVTGDR